MAKNATSWAPNRPGTFSVSSTNVSRITQAGVTRITQAGVTRVLESVTFAPKPTTAWSN